VEIPSVLARFAISFAGGANGAEDFKNLEKM
jgi:hypothetical protein